MSTWQDYMKKDGRAPQWPYPLRYDKQQEIEADVLVLGGGISGCWAAISAARTGAKVALVEKSATIRSGAGGPGCDHWCDTPGNPLSKVNPDEWAKHLAASPYSCGIGYQIQCRENYDTLLELEKMGGQIRDIEGKFKGCEGYDDATRFMISPRYNPMHDTNVVIRIFGTTFKPALKKECDRLGVKIYDRVMATSLLNEGGRQGARIVGATGINDRTGEFMVFKAKATVLAMSRAGSIWLMNTELAGSSTMQSRALSSDGYAISWKAGAEQVLNESSQVLRIATGYKHKWYTGAGDASYENVGLVDDNGKPLPVIGEPSWGKKRTDRSGLTGPWDAVEQGLKKGEYALPFWGDFPAMAEVERQATWNMLLKEESTTKIIVDTFGAAGFDPARDQLMNYHFIEGGSLPQWRESRGGGLIVDWDLKTTVDGLYAAGGQMFSPRDHSFAAATGRYAGRKAADYAKQVSSLPLPQEQLAGEKKRVYAPIARTEGLDWKELHFGISKVMQYFCSEFKNEKILNMGVDALNEIEEKWVPTLFAIDPHKLMRGLEDLSILAHAQLILQASLARKASSRILEFNRSDYPQVDPPEWNKFVTIKLENNKVKTGELAPGYYGDMKKNYEAHNKDYKGVYGGK